MKLARVTFFVLAITGTLWEAKSQNDSVMRFSLTEAQIYAVDHFYLSENARLDIESAKKKIWETTAIGLPQASVNANYTYIPGDIATFPIGEGIEIALAQTHSTDYGGSINQLIFSGEYIVGLQASKVYKLLSEESYDKVKMEIKESVSNSYFGLLILKENLITLNGTLQNLKTNYLQTKATFEAGLIDDVDVDQLNLTVKRTENSLNTLENQIRYMERLFKFQLGLDLNTSIELTDEIDNLIVVNLVNDSIYVFDIENNIDYKLLTTQRDLQNLSVKQQQSKYLPTLSGFYSYSNAINPPDFPPLINHRLGLSVKFSIFESGSRMAKISQEKIALLKAENIREQESRRLVLNAQQAKWDYQTALFSYSNEKINFSLSEKVLSKTTQRYKEGFVSSLDLSLVNNQFLQAQISYSTAIQQLLTAKIALDKAFNQL